VPNRPRAWLVLLTVATVACGGGKTAEPAPAPGAPPPRDPVKPFVALPFAGQRIAVVPITLLVPVDTLTRVPPLGDRAHALAWADSIVEQGLSARRPEVTWVFPAELRKIARRSPTVSPDPDRMGQSLLRDKSFETIPDPLRQHLRSLMAVASGRYAMVPAAVTLLPDGPGLVRVEITLVLTDTRVGKVIWRTVTWGLGATPERAFTAALDAVLPL
jgi:hypothetical protein